MGAEPLESPGVSYDQYICSLSPLAQAAQDNLEMGEGQPREYGSHIRIRAHVNTHTHTLTHAPSLTVRRSPIISYDNQPAP